MLPFNMPMIQTVFQHLSTGLDTSFLTCTVLTVWGRCWYDFSTRAFFIFFLILHPTVHFVTDKFSIQLHLSCCLDQRFQKQCLTHSFHSFHSLVSKPCRRCHMNSSQALTSLVGRGCFRLFSACHCCDIRPLCVYYTSARMQVNVILILKLKIMQMGLIFRLPTMYFMRLQLAKKAIRA